MTITQIVYCPFCGEENYVEVTEEQIIAINNGELIQNACPNLTATEREMLISGICPKCQEKIFSF